MHKDEVYNVIVNAIHSVTNEFCKDPSKAWFDFKNNCAGLTYEFSVALWHQNIVSAYRTKPAATQDNTTYHGGNVDVCVHKKDQTALYFKIPDKMYAAGDSGYCREPGKIVCIEDGHNDEFKEFMLQTKNRQESLHSWLLEFHVVSHSFRHGTSIANRMEDHQLCVQSLCVIVQYNMTNGHPLMEIWSEMVFVWLCICVYCMLALLTKIQASIKYLNLVFLFFDSFNIHWLKHSHKFSKTKSKQFMITLFY